MGEDRETVREASGKILQWCEKEGCEERKETPKEIGEIGEISERTTRDRRDEMVRDERGENGEIAAETKEERSETEMIAEPERMN
ncbi:hypothetical protein Syun_005135 [Stephania yunnanensis]|uniref:Uncharacterized protein n=1 Tax=Stephania yunnanensis TaxID=152371 RepID=A0AAP0L493_9MAGN